MMVEIPASTLYRDVSEALRRIIKDNITDVDVVFESPGEIEKSRDKRVILYLFESSENVFLRNQPPVVSVDANPVSVAAMYMNLHYMVVPYATPEAELILANQLTVIFRESPIVDVGPPDGALARTGNRELKIDPFYPSVDENHRIWGLFPNVNYKLTLYYEVWPLRIPLAPRRVPARVRELLTEYSIHEDAAGVE